MLKTYLNTVPCPKFVLIADTLETRDSRIFEHIVRNHLKQTQQKIHYFVFEGVFKHTEEKIKSRTNIKLYNLVSDRANIGKQSMFEDVIENLGDNDVIIVDSIAGAIFRYGLATTYRIFNTLKNNKALKQIVSVLHKDLVEGDYNEICTYFGNLSTLFIEITPTFLNDTRRIRYSYKKSGGKTISDIEEYRFEADQLITSKIAKPDASKLLEKPTSEEINPEDLATFRIGLTDEEKLSREKVVLPYLPKEKERESQGSTILYKFDEVDDWDEEDPDDDLDI